MKPVYKLVYIYQAVIWLISTINYIVGLFNFIVPSRNALSLIVHLIILCISIAVVCSNIYLLLTKDIKKSSVLKNLHFNKWVNVAQILNFQIMGLTYYTVIGARILMYYQYDETQKLAFGFGFFGLETELSYAKSNLIFVGINLIAILLYIIIEKNIRDCKQKLISGLL
jgi:hypothetical protein